MWCWSPCEPPQNTGHIAQAALTPNGSGYTGISLFIGGVPETVSVPVHLYTIYPGTCAALGERPAYEMNQTVIQNGNLGNGVPAFEARGRAAGSTTCRRVRAGGPYRTRRWIRQHFLRRHPFSLNAPNLASPSRQKARTRTGDASRPPGKWRSHTGVSASGSSAPGAGTRA
jgi:hypothetical protein